MAASFHPVTHVIFDMDGLLINTEDCYSALFAKILAEYGTSQPYELKLKCMGRKPHLANQILIDELNLPCTVDDIMAKMALYYEDIFSKCDLLPGAAKLINHLHSHGIPMGICTGSSDASYHKKINGVNGAAIRELFSKMEFVLSCGSDPEVKNGKPAPDAYLVAATRFKNGPVEPAKCLTFEDSPLGLDSAIDANMQCVMVPDSRLPESYRTRATQVIFSLEDFKPDQFGLPAFSE